MEDNTKLIILGQLKGGAKPQLLAQEHDVKYSVIKKWQSELAQAELQGDLSTLVDVDAMVVHELAKTVKEDIVETVSEVLEIDGKVIGKEVDSVVEGISGLQTLQTAVQQSAIRLTSQIDRQAIMATDTKELLELVSALTMLNNSFFKTSPNFNILNQTDMSSTQLNTFKGSMRDV